MSIALVCLLIFLGILAICLIPIIVYIVFATAITFWKTVFEDLFGG